MISGKPGGRIIIDELWADGAPDPQHISDAAAYFAEALRSGSYPPYHWNCRSTVRPQWGDGEPLTQDESDLINGRFRGNEIITSAVDQRGLSARLVRGRTL